MKYEIVREFPHEMLAERSDISISIYQPTSTHKPDNHQDRLVFKNHIQEARRFLLESYNPREVEKILSPLEELYEERMFWNKTSLGLAVFLNENGCIVYKIDRPLNNFLSISDQFHLKPLIRVYQSADNYYVLAVNRTDFKLFFGNRYRLNEAQLTEEGLSFEEYIDTTDRRNELSQGGAGIKGTGSGVVHGIGEKADIETNEIKTYFRYIDKLITDHYKDYNLPVVLAALPENQGLFRDITHNKNILEEGLNIDYNSLSLEDLKERSWELVESIYLNKTKDLIDRYNRGLGANLSDGDIHNIARYAVAGRIDTIMLESDRIIPGTIDLESGKIIKTEEEEIKGYDILDSLSKIVFELDGRVVVLPKERMPVDTGAAALYRY